MHNDISEIYFSEQDLANRVREMGEAITADYAGLVGEEGLVVVSILRGGAVFTCDLIRRIDLPLEVDFMAVSSYGSGTKSSGAVSYTHLVVAACPDDVSSAPTPPSRAAIRCSTMSLVGLVSRV